MPLTALGGASGTVVIGDTTTTVFPQTLHPNVMAYIALVADNGYSMTRIEIDAVNNMVLSMVSNGIWDKVIAVYPVIGGLANTHRINIKDPRDADSAYRLAFTGGWTHSSTGMTPNGTTAYANTFVIPSTGFTGSNDVHVSYYSRTNNLTIGYEFGVSYDAQSTRFQLIARYLTGGIANIALGSNISRTNANSTGYYMLNSNSTNAQLIKNGVVLNTGTATTNFSLYTTQTLLLAAERKNGVPNEFSSKQCAFASIGAGLSSVQTNEFYNIVQAFQTTLGRQV